MPNTPQQNGVVERKIATDRDRAFAMLLAAQLTENAQILLHAEAKSTATKLSNLIWTAQIDDIPNQKFNQERSNLQLEHLIQFGRIGYITIRKQIKKKWTDKSIKCIMVGYADDHNGKTYQMYDPMTNQVCCSRDIKWAEWQRTDPKATMRVFKQDKALGHKPMVGLDNFKGIMKQGGMTTRWKWTMTTMMKKRRQWQLQQSQQSYHSLWLSHSQPFPMLLFPMLLYWLSPLMQWGGWQIHQLRQLQQQKRN